MTYPKLNSFRILSPPKMFSSPRLVGPPVGKGLLNLELTQQYVRDLQNFRELIKSIGSAAAPFDFTEELETGALVFRHLGILDTPPEAAQRLLTEPAYRSRILRRIDEAIRQVHSQEEESSRNSLKVEKFATLVNLRFLLQVWETSGLQSVPSLIYRVWSQLEKLGSSFSNLDLEDDDVLRRRLLDLLNLRLQGWQAENRELLPALKDLSDIFLRDLRQELQTQGYPSLEKALLLMVPDNLRLVELRLHLEITGDLNRFIVNFNKEYYTPYCRGYNSAATCFVKAAGAGDERTFEEIWDQCQVSGPLCTLSVLDLYKALKAAAEGGKERIFFQLFSDPRIRRLLEEPLMPEEFEISESDLRVYNLAPYDLLKAAVVGSNFSIFEILRSRLLKRLVVWSLDFLLREAAKFDNLAIFNALLETRLDDFNLGEVRRFTRENLSEYQTRPETETLGAAAAALGLDTQELNRRYPIVTPLSLGYAFEGAVKAGSLETAQRLADLVRPETLKMGIEKAVVYQRSEVLAELLKRPEVTTGFLLYLLKFRVPNNFEIIKLLLDQPQMTSAALEELREWDFLRQLTPADLQRVRLLIEERE